MRWRMQTVPDQDAPQVDDALAIQIQRRDGGASGGRQPDQREAIRTPGEMLVPVVSARMEERNEFLADRINGVCLIVFFVVAALTSQREVVGVGRSTPRFRSDVFVGKNISGMRIGADAILATAARAFVDQPLQFRRNAPFSHAARAGVLIAE